MRLNRQLIRDELKRQDINYSELARRIGCSRALVNYHKQKKVVTLANVRFWAKALRIPAKNLLVF